MVTRLGNAWSSHVQRGRAVTTSEQGRRLLTPDEVRRLPKDEQLLFLRGTEPIRCASVDYRTLRAFRGRFEPNPMHTEAAGPHDARPLYLQIMDEVRRALVVGPLRPEDPLPSVRELASELIVNSRTVSQAYRELEREGIVEVA